MTYRIMMAALALAGCQSSGDADRDTRPYNGIGEGETIRFLGTEPFWGGQVTGDRLHYDTLEHPDGITIEVDRFAGNNGVSYSGTLDGAPFDMTVTEGECSDGMSDRLFPFTVTLRIGEQSRFGCGYTRTRPFEDPEMP